MKRGDEELGRANPPIVLGLACVDHHPKEMTADLGLVVFIAVGFGHHPCKYSAGSLELSSGVPSRALRTEKLVNIEQAIKIGVSTSEGHRMSTHDDDGRRPRINLRATGTSPSIQTIHS